MQGSAKERVVAELRARIAGVERRAPLAGTAERERDGAALPFRHAPPGLLHEIWSASAREAGGALGFALGQGRRLIGRARQAVLFLQLAHEAQETGLPYGAGLKSFGFDPQALTLGRPRDIGELLWAIEEAVACRAVAAVVADIGGAPRALDFTASRRLSLRAQASGGSVFLVRYGAQREASAAALRWRVEPAPSAPVRFDDRAPGDARLKVVLEKSLSARGVGGLKGEWILNWTEAHGWDLADGDQGAGRAVAGAPAYGAPPAALGDRLSQAG
ncbi:MAG TPA: hypothetical protein VIL84_11570 [Devosiaceae bacterium]